jgi:hypothetical protein
MRACKIDRRSLSTKDEKQHEVPSRNGKHPHISEQTTDQLTSEPRQNVTCHTNHAVLRAGRCKVARD